MYLGCSALDAANMNMTKDNKSTHPKQPIGIVCLTFACLSGLLMTAAFPKIGNGLVAWFALVPLFMALRNLSPFDGFRIGFLTGIVHYLTLLYWFIPFLTTYGPFPTLISTGILCLLSSYLAVYIGLFSMAIVSTRVSPYALWAMAPVFWVCLEYVRTTVFSGFPWELLGHTQYNALHIIQISDIVGVYGISFLIMMSNVLLFFLYQVAAKQDWQGYKTDPKFFLVYVFFFCGLIGAVWNYGDRQISSMEKKIAQAPTKKIAVVQGNIDQTQKWDPAYQISTLKKYFELSNSLSAQQWDLIVWPETAMPFYFSTQVPLTRMVLENIRSSGIDTLLGSPAYSREEKRVRYFNRAFLIRASGTIADAYDKAHLVPFGEYVPMKRWLPFLGKMVAQVGDFSTGMVGDTLSWGKHEIGALICYEMIFPYLSRAAVRHGAHLLVNITNDAWYGQTSAPFQHFSMAVFRAIETRRTLVRSANTGISGIIDPLGRVIRQTPIFKDAVFGEAVPLMSGLTPYVKLGDFFARFCSMVSLIIVLLSQTLRVPLIRKIFRRK